MDKEICTNENKSSTEEDHQSAKTKKRAPTALTIECGVCSGPAPDHLHFGARCCYSCRAFFRRTAPRSSSLRCRSGLGKCDVSHRNKKCISCRYGKCLDIGMDPQLVQGSRMKRDNIDQDDNQIDEEEQEDSNDKKSLDVPLVSASLNPKSSHQIDNVPNSPVHFSNSEKSFPETQSIINKGNEPQNTNFQPENSFTKRQNNTDEIQQPLSNPYFKFAPPYGPHFYPRHPFPFPYGRPPSHLAEGYAQRTLQNSSYAHRSRMLHSSPYQQQIQQNNHFGFKYNDFKSNREQIMFGPANETMKDLEQTEAEPRKKGSIEAVQAAYEPQSHCNKYNNFAPYTIKDKSLGPPNHDKPNPSRQTMPGNLCKRTSVITSVQSSELEYKAKMLKYEGSILRHTGNLFSYHANLLERERKNSQEKSVIQNHIAKIEEDIKQEDAIIKTENNLPHIEPKIEKDKDSFPEDLANDMFIEAQELIKNSPWLTNLTGGEVTPKNAPEENEQNMPWLQSANKYDDVDSITDLHFTSDDLNSDVNAIHPFPPAQSYSQRSVIQSPGFSPGHRMMFHRNTNA